MAQKQSRILPLLLLLASMVAIGYFGRGFYYHAMTIHKLLLENKQLKQAITNLTDEQQIGYAKVLAQDINDGRLYTTLKFVETDRNDKTKKILEKHYILEGDIIYFDALIVKFGDKMVMDGKSRALYLWRRVYGEAMAPNNGLLIEQPGTEPQRYSDILKTLPIKHRELFWSAIWDLALDPEKLAQYDITAIYGNAVYQRLRKGLIYTFKITPTGQFYPEITPDL